MTELFLSARIAGRPVAIAAAAVEAVVDLGPIVPVPGAHPAVVGLAALRSRVVTVIDPATKLGAGRSTTSRRAVIARRDGHHYAVLADAVEDILPLALAPLGAIAPGAGWSDVARGIVTPADAPVLAIALDALIPLPA